MIVPLDSHEETQHIKKWVQQARQCVYRPHCMTYGKLMTGDDPYGKILPRYEHQRTIETEGFPKDLQPFCSPTSLFPGWSGLSNSIEQPWHDGAAFALRTVTAETGQVYHVFCKVMPWLENSKNPGSRVFTHMNLWCFEKEEFDILASVWIMYKMFFPWAGGDELKFTRPAVVSLGELLKIPRMSFSFGVEENYWDAIKAILLDVYTPDEYIAAFCNFSSEEFSSHELAKLRFIAQSLYCVFREIRYFRSEPESTNFVVGLSAPTIAGLEKIRRY